MCRMVTTLAIALMLSLSSMAAAGEGANCDKSHAKATHAGNKSHDGHAGNARVDFQAKAKHGWLGLEVGLADEVVRAELECRECLPLVVPARK